MKREAGDGPFKKIVPLYENIFCKEEQIKDDLMTTWRQLKIDRDRENLCETVCELERENGGKQVLRIAYAFRM